MLVCTLVESWGLGTGEIGPPPHAVRIPIARIAHTAVSCPSCACSLCLSQALWDELKGGFRTAVESFELVTPSDSYIPPDKNPWLFF